MKTIAIDDDFSSPILFLFVYSLMLGLSMGEAREIILNTTSPTLLSQPVLFADSILETIGNICYFWIPLAIFFIGLKQKRLLLKTVYLLGTVPFVLTQSVILKLGYRSLYGVKTAILFIIVILLMRHLKKTVELYKVAIERRR